jgi:hypothetical protein
VDLHAHAFLATAAAAPAAVKVVPDIAETFAELRDQRLPVQVRAVTAAPHMALSP